MQLQLVPGLHTAIIANASPGHGGSQFSLETYMVCKKVGIPAILATFDHSREYPNIGSDLRRLFMPGMRQSPHTHPKNMDDLSQVIDEVSANRKFLIIDVPAAFTLRHPMFGVLRSSGILDASSTTALVPIMAGDSGTSGAASTLRTLRSFGFSFDRGIHRQWRFRGDLSPSDMSRLPNYPVWHVGFLSQLALEFIYQEVSRVGNPALNHLPRLREIQARERLPAAGRESLQQAIEHLETAQNIIYRAILAPISTRTS